MNINILNKSISYAKNWMLYLVTVVVLTIASTGDTEAATQSLADAAANWQLKHLFTPSEQAIQQEQDSVFIYQGLTDREVNKALDQQFDRIQHMMFTSIVVTDANGEVLRDPETGKAVVEDDGC